MCPCFAAQIDCDIKLVNVDENGVVTSDSQPWIEDYTDFLIENDVDEDRITVIRDEKRLKPVDVLCNLEGFADRYPARFLEIFHLVDEHSVALQLKLHFIQALPKIEQVRSEGQPSSR